MTDNPNFILPPGSRQAVGLTGPVTPPPAINEPMPIVLDTTANLDFYRVEARIPAGAWDGSNDFEVDVDPSGSMGANTWDPQAAGRYLICYTFYATATESFTLTLQPSAYWGGQSFSAVAGEVSVGAFAGYLNISFITPALSGSGGATAFNTTAENVFGLFPAGIAKLDGQLSIQYLGNP